MAFRKARQRRAPRYRLVINVMVDPATPPSTKVRAADSVLNYTAKAIKIEDIEARVQELERAAEKSGRENK